MVYKIEKSRNDERGRCYYWCQCAECGEKIEVRSDRIIDKKHNCKPKFRQRIKIQNKKIKQAAVSEIVLIANSQIDLNNQINTYKQFYHII